MTQNLYYSLSKAKGFCVGYPKRSFAEEFSKGIMDTARAPKTEI
jgi:hypothetical protein